MFDPPTEQKVQKAGINANCPPDNTTHNKWRRVREAQAAICVVPRVVDVCRCQLSALLHWLDWCVRWLIVRVEQSRYYI